MIPWSPCWHGRWWRARNLVRRAWEAKQWAALATSLVEMMLEKLKDDFESKLRIWGAIIYAYIHMIYI